ncbi:hypothetical protein HHI36_007010 [Cryptolaemus montrouzieri]|uniref:Reverse transcriptase domain-containing protein n=1 Tax=Cryptolaemus montrouzieri TaxID=559131 RepID=A0ABD2MNF2_9CUCU
MLKCLSYCHSYLYADDIQLYYSFPRESFDEALIKVNLDLERLSGVSVNMCLKLNLNKTVAMLFERKQMREQCKHSVHILLGDTEIPLSNESRNLGLIIDTDLRFISQVNLLCKGTFPNIKLIYGCKEFLDIRA